MLGVIFKSFFIFYVRNDNYEVHGNLVLAYKYALAEVIGNSDMKGHNNGKNTPHMVKVLSLQNILLRIPKEK